MRRALSLILILSVISFGSGWYLDRLRQHTAEKYLHSSDALGQLISAERWEEALSEVRVLSARWAHDARWLKCLISHHHTREVEAAFARLETALKNRWMDEALPAVDDAQQALWEVYCGHLPTLENVV